jgi:CBS domain-containing protein
MKIRELMSRPAVTCPDTATLDTAAWLMWEFDCGVIPVVDDAGHAVGIVTDRDICMAAYTQGKALREIPVTTAMAHHVIAIRADESVETAEHLMADNQIRRIPVVDTDGQVIGVLSLNDVVRQASCERQVGVDREFVETLAAVSQPRGSETGESRDQLAPVTH